MNGNIEDGQRPKARNLWSKEEDDILRCEVARQADRGKAQDWRAIAAKLPGRNNKDTRKRWIKLDGQTNKGAWSADEDQRLREAVRHHSTAWTEVARAVGSRHADQCAKRWLHFLSPALNHSEWTERDDTRLLAAVEKRGHNWRQIVDEELHGRSATDAKNRYTILQRSRRNCRNSSDPRGSSAAAARPSRRKTVASLPCKSSSRTMEKCETHGSIIANQPTDQMGRMKGIASDAASNGDAFMSLEHDTEDSIFMPQDGSGFEFPANFMTFQQEQRQQQHHYHQQDNTITPSPDWQALHLPTPTQHPMSGALEYPPSSFTDVPFGGPPLLGPYNQSCMEIAGNAQEGPAALQTPPVSAYSPDFFNGTPESHAGFASREGPGEEEEEGEEERKEESEESEEEDGDGIEEEERTGSEKLAKSLQKLPVSKREHRGSCSSKRESTMILQNVQPDLVGEVLGLVLSSGSKIDVKILSR